MSGSDDNKGKGKGTGKGQDLDNEAIAFDIDPYINSIDRQDARRNKTLNEKQDAAIRALVNSQQFVSSDEIEHVLSEKKEMTQLEKAIAVDQLQQFAAPHGIDLSQIYCKLTGQSIGFRNLDNLALMLDIHGFVEAERALMFCVQSAVAAHWQNTSPAILDKLSVKDPCGYFVYAAGRALQKAGPKDDAEHELIFMLDKIKLHAWLERFCEQDAEHIRQVIKCNEAWRNLLGIVHPSRLPDTIKWPYASLTSFVENDEIIWELHEHLAIVLSQVMKRDASMRAKIHATYGDLLALKEKYGGLSQFYMQNALRTEIKLDAILLEIDKSLKDNNFDIEPFVKSAIRHSVIETHARPKVQRVKWKDATIDAAKARTSEHLLDQLTAPQQAAEGKSTNVGFRAMMAARAKKGLSK